MEKYLLPPIRIDTLKNKITEEIAKRIETILETFVPKNNETNLLTRNDAARYLGISLVTLNEWSKQGIIQAYCISSRINFKKVELELCLKKMKNYKQTI